MRHLQIASLSAALFLGACADQPTIPADAVDGASLSRASQSLEFAIIEVPGARFTGASGINSDGAIVGTYVDANGTAHGYLLEGGVFTPVDYPGAVMTEARGIGPSGEIVGTYRLPGDTGPKVRSFLRRPDGSFETVAYPGHTSTMAQRILSDGTILGCRHDENFASTMRGVVIHADGSHSETDAFASMHNGATPDLRRIAGLYTNGGRTEAYVIEDGVFKSFMVPGSTMTAAWDVNLAGKVVGVYRNSTGFHGFVRTGDHYHSIDFPDAAATRALGINDQGDVVGTYVSGGKGRGFLATSPGTA